MQSVFPVCDIAIVFYDGIVTLRRNSEFSLKWPLILVHQKWHCALGFIHVDAHRRIRLQMHCLRCAYKLFM